MTTFVDRTCSEVQATNDGKPASHPLSHYAKRFAWVLLGPPGAGKTVEFQREAKRRGAHYVTARDFLTLSERRWRSGTLFIDALDEIRAGSPDGRTPLDRIRTKLDELGRPPFRLSCREADWFGASDRGHLAAVSADRDVLELRLEPLSDEQILHLLGRHVADPEAFLHRAGQAGLSALLATPQDLELLATAVASGSWPDTRLETFELACRQLAREQNEEHLVAAEGEPFATEQLLDAAGDLCAVALLSGHAGYTVASAVSHEQYVRLNDMQGSPPLLRAALHTRLFAYATPQRATPMHRQVAEFLAARRLARTIDDGLPPARVTALMTGPDGGVVSSLRGLCAWLSAHSAKIRPDCIARDPLGTLLYGDAKRFTAPQKRELVAAITRLAWHDPWILRNRFELDVRWGDLATRHTEPMFRDILGASGQDDAEQRLARALLLALYHGSPVPGLERLLMDTVRDGRLWAQVRGLALGAFIRQYGGSGRTARRQLRQLLQDIEAGTVSDPNHDLLGVLLSHLYPKEVSPTEVLRYLHEPDDPMWVGEYRYFWHDDMVRNTTDDAVLGKLLDALIRDRRERIADDTYLQGHLAKQMLTRLLKGPMNVTAERLFNWLDVLVKLAVPPDPVGEHGDEAWDSFSDWRCKNPDRWKQLYAAADGQPTREWILHRCQEVGEGKSWVPAPGDEDRRWREQWQAFLRANRSQMQDGCPPGLLHELADMGWGRMPFVEGILPIERLRSLLEDDGLVQLALGATRDTPQRADLPTFDEVATLRRSAPHPLSLPYRAAFDLLRASEVAKLGESGLRLALAFQFEASIPGGDWYEATLKASPRLVASALVDYCRAAFRCGNIPHWPLAQLAQDAHAKVAEFATLDLLKLFPPRCRTEYLPTLRCLLFAALERCSRRKLSAQIEHKLSLRGLTALQRVHWLSCGLTLACPRHLQPLLGSLAGRYQHQRIQCIVTLMRERVLRVERLDPPVLLPLVELLAERCPPASLSDSDGRYPIPESVGEAADAANAVRHLLDHLASLATAEATDAVKQLAANVALVRWRPEVQHALANQLATRREAEFRHAGVAEVQETLGGATPANAADLAALVADCLTALAGRVAAGDTSDWRQYWNTEGKRVKEPKYEELCRDALLSDLRQDLPSGLTAISEAVHAADRRSDILVSFGDFAVPVEAKQSFNRDLWKAMHAQLIGSYAKDPAAQGHGVYLVFWFGRDRCQLPPDGCPKPRTAAELATRLRETLTPEQRRKITVIVMDVSGPAHIP